MGTVTFLFSDIEGSTRLWQSRAAAMQEALPRHDELLRAVFDRHRGQVFATGGDGFAVAFARAGDALAAAEEAQAALAAEDWPADAVLRVRMGIHTGEAVERDGDYFGSAVNRTARLMALAHGGQVVCTATTLGVVEEPPATLDLGEHRLRDLLAPVHVHQIGTEPFPPLRSNALVPTNLPTPPTDLIGREDDVAALVADLAAHRLVTVTGVGGMGKTRLAVEVAAALAGDHPDGVWFVDLAPALDGGDVIRAVGGAMGATGASSSTDALVDHLAGRTTLLVLDNCEHVIDAAADLAGQVLARAPEVRLLATSREPLDVAGETVKHLRPLALPQPTAPGVSTAVYPALRLFEERAAAVRSGFVVDDENVDDVVEICRRLDGVPLAIELAAARVGAMSTADIRARLGERFRLLAGARRGHERHRTLLATVDWSYGLLDPEEQRAFRTLSVFAGSFGLADAAAVVAGPEGDEFAVLDQVTRLVERSLVNHDGETGRYRLLETLRQFGDDRLTDAGEAEEARTRFADHFLAMALREGPRMGGADHDEARAVLLAAIDNLRAMAEWLGTAGRLQDLATMAAPMWTFLSQEAPAETIGWFRPALDAGDELDLQVRYDALWSVASNTMIAGNFTDALALHEQVRALAAEHPEIAESGWAYQVPVLVAIFTGDRDDLRASAERMRQVAVLRGDPTAETFARGCLLQMEDPDDPAFQAATEQLLADARAIGGPVWWGSIIGLLTGAFLEDEGAVAQAPALLSLIDRDPGWHDSGSTIESAILNSRSAALAMVDPPAAVPVLAEATVVTDRLGAVAAKADQALIASYAALRLDEAEQARRLYRHHLAVAPFEAPFYEWMRRDLLDAFATAGFGPDDLTPQALGRHELFALLVELQQRHPVAGG